MPETNGKDLGKEPDACVWPDEAVADDERGDKYQPDPKHTPPESVARAMDRNDQRKVAHDELPGLTETEMAALAPPAKTGIAPVMSADKAESILDAQVMNIVGVVTRGLIVSSAGVPPDVLLRSMARCFARVVGEAIAGDLVPVWQVRTSVREAFEKTLRTIPVKPNPQPQRMPGQPQMRG